MPDPKIAIVAMLVRRWFGDSCVIVRDMRTEDHGKIFRKGMLSTVETLAELIPWSMDGFDSITGFHEAAIYGQTGVIRILLDHKVNARLRECHDYYLHGSTSLHLAAVEGLSDTPRALCQHAASISAKDDIWKGTALRQAARYGHVATLQFLVDYGAVLEATDLNGETPVGLALCYEIWDAVTVLQKLGAHIRSSRQ